MFIHRIPYTYIVRTYRTVIIIRRARTYIICSLHNNNIIIIIHVYIFFFLVLSYKYNNRSAILYARRVRRVHNIQLNDFLIN